MNFTFLPSSSFLIHSSSAMFVTPQAISKYDASIRFSVQEIADGNEKSAIVSLSLEVFEVGQTDIVGFFSIMPFSSPYKGTPSNGMESGKLLEDCRLDSWLRKR